MVSYTIHAMLFLFRGRCSSSLFSGMRLEGPYLVGEHQGLSTGMTKTQHLCPIGLAGLGQVPPPQFSWEDTARSLQGGLASIFACVQKPHICPQGCLSVPGVPFPYLL